MSELQTTCEYPTARELSIVQTLPLSSSSIGFRLYAIDGHPGLWCRVLFGRIEIGSLKAVVNTNVRGFIRAEVTEDEVAAALGIELEEEGE